jgi:hypothetical protein
MERRLTVQEERLFAWGTDAQLIFLGSSHETVVHLQ